MLRWGVKLVVVLACVLGASPVYAQYAGRIFLPFPGTAPGAPVVVVAPGSHQLTLDIATLPVGAPSLTIAMPGPAAAGQHVVIEFDGHILSNAANPGFPVVLFTGPAPQELVLRNGTLIGGSDGVMAVGGARKIVLENMQIGGSGVNGIHISNAENVVIRRCVITNSAGTGIVVDSPGVGVGFNGNISENMVRRTVGVGIAVAGAGGGTSKGTVILENNQLEDIATGFPVLGGAYPGAMSLVNLEPCRASGNTIRGVNGMGIYGGGLEGCYFTDNVLSDMALDGVQLNATSYDNYILHNMVRGSFVDALHIFGSWNTIEGNALHSTAPGGAGFGVHFAAGSASNHYGRNSVTGNAGGRLRVPDQRAVLRRQRSGRHELFVHRQHDARPRPALRRRTP